MPLCQCGCGGHVPERKYPSQQGRFITGHNSKVGRPPEYLEEDRGYTTPCWVWQRAKSRYGYGILNRSNTQLQAHRHYYEQAKGPIPDGRHLHHHCEQRDCVNPDHLEILTARMHGVTHRRNRTLNDPEIVSTIRRLRNDLTQWELARAFQIHQSQVSKILRNENYYDPDYTP